MLARDIGLAVLTSVIWGLAFIATKFGLDGFSAAQLVVLRFAVAAIPVLVLPRPPVGWGVLIAIGLTLFSGQFLFLFFAYGHGLPPGLASVTQQMQAFFTIALAAVFLRDFPTRRQALGAVVAFCGLLLIGATVGGEFSLPALGFALAASLSWAVGNILVKTVGSVSMVSLMAWASLFAPLPALLVSVFLGDDINLVQAIAGAPWLAIASAIYLGTLSTNVAYAIWSRLLARYSAALVAPFALLVPCTGVIASALIFGERFSPLRYAGMALIVLSLAIIVLPSIGTMRRLRRR
jgi:O-acetylserine/cysteine efflux transporter